MESIIKSQKFQNIALVTSGVVVLIAIHKIYGKQVRWIKYASALTVVVVVLRNLQKNYPQNITNSSQGSEGSNKDSNIPLQRKKSHGKKLILKEDVNQVNKYLKLLKIEFNKKSSILNCEGKKILNKGFKKWFNEEFTNKRSKLSQEGKVPTTISEMVRWGERARKYDSLKCPTDLEKSKKLEWKLMCLEIIAMQYLGLPYDKMLSAEEAKKLSKKVYPLEVTKQTKLFKNMMYSPLGKGLRGHFPNRGLGLDCSNFISFLYSLALGISFSSSIKKLANPIKSKRVGYALKPNEKLEKGDILIFDGPIKHVVLLLDPSKKIIIDSTRYRWNKTKTKDKGVQTTTYEKGKIKNMEDWKIKRYPGWGNPYLICVRRPLKEFDSKNNYYLNLQGKSKPIFSKEMQKNWLKKVQDGKLNPLEGKV